MLHFSPILRFMGWLLLVLGVMILTSLLFADLHNVKEVIAIGVSGAIGISLGSAMWYVSRHGDHSMGRREGYLVVALSWLVMVSYGSLPYLISGVIPDFTNAFFETMSGMTTTGASIINDIEAMPRGILYWRSLTQWIGGMGIIVLTVAIFPNLGMGGVQVFSAEAPGPTSSKLTPRIRDTAKRLWFIYVALTALLGALLWLFGMSGYDAINHALTTMATGGFSTRNASIAAFPRPEIQYVICLFMLLAGTNYAVLYTMINRQWRQVIRDNEFQAYLVVVVLATALISMGLSVRSGEMTESIFRDSLFQVVSLVTTTGFVSADYALWGTPLIILCLMMMFLGASAGSTSGGIKIIRHLVFFKNARLEFRRILHPKAIIPLKINGSRVRGKVITHIIIFFLIYVTLFVVGTLVLSILGLDFETSIGASATSLGNVGPGIGEVGPTANFAGLSSPVKWVLCFLMLLGRLELFTILLLFTRYFWENR